MKNRILALAATTRLCVGGWHRVVGQQPAPVAPKPALSGQEIVAKKCSVCHALRKAASNDPVLMKEHMKKKGELSEQEIALAVAYLSDVRSGKATLPTEPEGRKKHGKHKENED